ncbi:unnamed protein product [marine sediment metagenome]|uniref:Uncharacterized protein n=1 Tax=marine sediment metagenome TaxID=412755 RepID=X1TXC3_9ZZZZ
MKTLATEEISTSDLVDLVVKRAIDNHDFLQFLKAFVKVYGE